MTIRTVSPDHDADAPQALQSSDAGHAPMGARAVPICDVASLTFRRARWALLACIIYATFLAIFPHVCAYLNRGTLEYLSFRDDLAYLHASIPPYYGSPVLRDPYSSDWEGGLFLGAWAQFVPVAKLASALGVSVALIPMLWRLIGAPFLGAGMFLIFRHLLARTRWPVSLSFACALIALSDAGLIGGRPVIDQMLLLRHLRAATTPWVGAHALTQYRVITPILNFPFVFLLCAALQSAGRPVRAAILGAVCLGVCCLLYFFAWTGAAVGLGIYLVALLLRGWSSRTARTENWRRAVVVAAALFGGLVIGAPQILVNVRTAGDPAMKAYLNRAGRPMLLPDHTPPWSVRNTWSYLALAVGAAALAYLRLPGLGLVYSFLVGGFLLCNSAWVTRLDFENYHWLQYVARPFGEIVVLAAAAGLVDRLRGGWPVRVAAVAAVGLVAVMVVIAIVWIPFEAVHAPDAVLYNRLSDELRPLRPQLAALRSDRRIDGQADVIGVALLETRAASLYWHPYTWNNATAPLDVLDERHALHGWLLGLDEAAYRRLAEQELYVMAATQSEERRQRAKVVDDRLAAFRRIGAAGAAAEIERYRVSYLIVPSGFVPTRGGPWVRRGGTDVWTLWERTSDGLRTADLAGKRSG